MCVCVCGTGVAVWEVAESREVHFPHWPHWVARLSENFVFVFAEINHSPTVFCCYDAQEKFFFSSSLLLLLISEL